jgi:hypothetical protein
MQLQVRQQYHKRPRYSPALCSMLMLMLVCAACDDRRASHAAEAFHDVHDTALFLTALARDTFFHFIEPSVSPFICSRSPLLVQHPLIFRLSDVAVEQLRTLRAAFLRVDVALFQAPDADTGTCPDKLTERSVAQAWCSAPTQPP